MLWIMAIVTGLLLFLISWPVYIVGPNEEAIVQTLGKYSGSQSSGMHFKLPWPIQKVTIVAITMVHRLEVGFRTIDPGPPPNYRNASNDAAMLAEAQMLTGDENIVNADLMVQWRISHAPDFIFNTRDPEMTLRALAESVTRQVIGDFAIDEALTTGKGVIQLAIQDRLSELVSEYRMGIAIEAVLLGEINAPQQVNAAFKDVATAKEDKSKVINEAAGYRNDKIPKARGEAAQLLQEAQGYAAERIAKAQGDASRFRAIAEEYKKAPRVTKSRLYLEAMKTVYGKVKITIIDGKVGLLNMKELTK